MAVQFYSSPAHPLVNCPCCEMPLTENVMMHEEEEEFLAHPVHRECLRRWVLIQSECPTCGCDIDSDSLLSCSERIGQLYDNLKDLFHDLAPAHIAPVSAAYIGFLAANLSVGLAYEYDNMCPAPLGKTALVIALTAGSMGYDLVDRSNSAVALLASYVSLLVLAALN